MSPDELELIINRALEEGLTFPWWLYLSAIIATFVGGFMGAYLKRKGENLATKEDYDSLLEQVKKTTTATESIKNDLAKGSWLHQQSWFLKEKYYSGLLGELYKLRASLSARSDHYMEPGSEHHDEAINQNSRYKNQTKIGFKALQKIREIHGPAEMVISKPAVDSLNKFYSADWHAENFSECNQSYLHDVYASVDKTYKAVLKEAQSDLK